MSICLSTYRASFYIAASEFPCADVYETTLWNLLKFVDLCGLYW